MLGRFARGARLSNLSLSYLPLLHTSIRELHKDYVATGSKAESPRSPRNLRSAPQRMRQAQVPRPGVTADMTGTWRRGWASRLSLSKSE